LCVVFSLEIEMGQFAPQSRLKRASDRMLWRAAGSETIVVDPDSGASFVLNAVGAAVWELLDDEKSIADITTAICDSYEVVPERAQRDIVEWAEWMADRGLVTVEGAAAGLV
jgi:hypothetical protein